MDIARRQKLIAQSLLENEALRESLDDDAAKSLLDWLLPQAERIARSTAQIEDEEEADEVMYPQLKALRKLAKYVNRWIEKGSEQPLEEHAKLLRQILEYADTMYGDNFTPDEKQQERFVQNAPSLLSQPETFIHKLHQFIEGGI